MARSFCLVTIRLKDVSHSPLMTLESIPFVLGPTPLGGLEGTGWYASMSHSNSSMPTFHLLPILVHLAFHDCSFFPLSPIHIPPVTPFHTVLPFSCSICTLHSLLFCSTSPPHMTCTLLPSTLTHTVIPCPAACTSGPTNRGAGSQLS